MSGEAFTRGPWVVRQWDGDEWPERRISIGPESDGHAIAVLMSPRFPAPNILDDAQLAAAAPRMYHRLRLLAGVLKDMGLEYEATETEAVLAQARGETP